MAQCLTWQTILPYPLSLWLLGYHLRLMLWNADGDEHTMMVGLVDDDDDDVVTRWHWRVMNMNRHTHNAMTVLVVVVDFFWLWFTVVASGGLFLDTLLISGGLCNREFSRICALTLLGGWIGPQRLDLDMDSTYSTTATNQPTNQPIFTSTRSAQSTNATHLVAAGLFIIS